MKGKLAVLFAGLMGIVQLVYWILAFTIATGHMMGGFDGVWWTSASGGSLFPWPSPPGFAQMVVRANPTDSFFYYLIVSWMFIPLAIGATAVAGFVGWLIGAFLERVLESVKRRTKGSFEESVNGLKVLRYRMSNRRLGVYNLSSLRSGIFQAMTTHFWNFGRGIRMMSETIPVKMSSSCKFLPMEEPIGRI